MLRLFLGLLLISVLFGCPSAPVNDTAPEAVTPTTDPSPPPPSSPPENQPVNQEVKFQVSQQVYNETFGEIEELILKLNRIIQNGQFSVWRDFLTDTYIQKFSDPVYLRELSQNPILQRRGIRLTNLRHYFDEVVVMSRANAKLDKIEFIDNNRVVAFMEIQGEMSILYQLIKINGSWKITVW